MHMLANFPLLFGDAASASNVMRSYVTPVLGTMIALASLAVVFFLVYGGIQYITSSGDPEKLDYAKRVIRNAIIGLVIVIAAGTLTAILSQAYQSSGSAVTEKLPALTAIEPKSESFTEVMIKTIAGVLKSIIVSGAKPFLTALNYFTNATPLMAENGSVFNLWLTIVGITDVLFIVVVALLGFHIMSFTALGLDEIEFKHLLPRLAVIFLLINTSIFAIDAVISLSNAMIRALQAGFPSSSVWDALTGVAEQANGLSLAALLLMIAFLVLIVMLLVYYVFRLVVLYLGAVLAPLIFLVWLIPVFKDFAETAMKVYLTTIFVLFVHVVILQLGASILDGMIMSTPGQPLNPVMSMIVGIALALVLLKTQGTMSQLSYASLGPRTAHKIGGQVMHVVSYYKGKRSQGGNDGGSNGSGDEAEHSSSQGKSKRKYTASAPSPTAPPPKESNSSTTRKAPRYESTSSSRHKDDIDYPTAASKPAPRKTRPKKQSKEDKS